MKNLRRESGTPSTELLSKVGLPRCKQSFVPAEQGWDCSSSAIGPKIFTAPTWALTLQGHAHVLCSRGNKNLTSPWCVNPSNPKCSVKYLTESLILLKSCLQSELPRTVLQWIQSETALPGIPSWDLRPENSRATSPEHRTSHFTHSPAQVAWESTVFQTQLGLDLQVNSKETWEGLLQFGSQVPGSPDGSLEALITRTLSELLLPQLKTWASFQGPW